MRSKPVCWGVSVDNCVAFLFADDVLGALRAMVDPGRFGLSPARVTVSTVGMVPRIRSLSKVSQKSLILQLTTVLTLLLLF